MLLGNNLSNNDVKISNNKKFDVSLIKKYTKVDKTKSTLVAYYFIDNVSLIPVNKTMHELASAQTYWLDSIYSNQTLMINKLHFPGGMKGYLKYVGQNLKPPVLPFSTQKFITDCQTLVVKYSLNSEHQIIDYAIDQDAQPHFYKTLLNFIKQCRIMLLEKQQILM